MTTLNGGRIIPIDKEDPGVGAPVGGDGARTPENVPGVGNSNYCLQEVGAANGCWRPLQVLVCGRFWGGAKLRSSRDDVPVAPCASRFGLVFNRQGTPL